MHPYGGIKRLTRSGLPSMLSFVGAQAAPASAG